MTFASKLTTDLANASLDEIKEVQKKLAAAARLKKNTAPRKAVDTLIALENEFGIDGLKVAYAERRRAWKAAQDNGEDDLKGLDEDAEGSEENDNEDEQEAA